MITRKIQSLHDTLYINLPRILAEIIGIKKGDRVRIDVEKNKIVITPIPAAKVEIGESHHVEAVTNER